MLEFQSKYASNVYSQNGEDGILKECLRRMEIAKGLAVEFGADDGIINSNTRHLIEQGWSAKFIESDREKFNQCESHYSGNDNVICMNKEVKTTNVDLLVGTGIDVLSIDIEGTDYQIWKTYQGDAKIVIIEINSGRAPHLDVTEDGANYSAMVKLGMRKGYVLLCHTGNLIFIKKEYMVWFPELFRPVEEGEDTEHLLTVKMWNLPGIPIMALIDPLERIDLFFKTDWLPADMPRKFEHPKITNTKKIGILVTATWRFIDFVPQFLQSLNHFCPGYEKKIFLFTDHIDFIPPTNLPGEVQVIRIPHKPFPVITLERYKRYTIHAEKFSGMDYLFHSDIDMQVVDVGPEILNPLTAVTHPYFIDGGNSYEKNDQSTAYIPIDLFTQYVCGGVQGGESGLYLQICRELSERIEVDDRNGLMAEWHDESHWNWYYAHNKNNFTLLHAGYCYPEQKPIPFEKKIIALDKDRSKYRPEQ